MSEPLVIAANSVKARLIGADRNTRLAVSSLISFQVEGHEHSDRFKLGYWDGRSSFYEFTSDTFPAGFVPAVESHLRQLGHQVLLKRKRLPEAIGPDLRTAYDSVSPFKFDPRFDYQMETVRRLEKHGQMIAQVATGGGKSMIARTAVKRLGRPALFLTTRQVLMYQMADGFKEAGYHPGIVGDSTIQPRRDITCAMIQTIAARLSNPSTAENTRKFLSIFELAILEEAHEAGGSSYFDVMNEMENASYRLSLTATPFMRGDGEANMRLMAVSGQIGVKVSEKMLIDRGILARPVFKFADTAPFDKLKRHSGWQRAYDLGIVNNPNRNKVIVDEVCRAVSHGLPGMILIQRTAHGAILQKMFRDRGIRVEFIQGKDDQATRQRALKKLGSGGLQVLIGSTILDVGVDVPAVGIVVLAGGGKAEVALRQRIGRGLRAKKTGPNVCFVLDFVDAGNRYLKDHAVQRRGIIEATEGFVENILPRGQDFPYEAVGLSLINS